MKRILLFLCLGIVLFQSGCAVPPPTDEQSLQQQKDDQAAQKSDTFGRGLGQ
ncbi:MAG: hypothetical protein ABI540_05350 [Spartobacteria bacterium]